VSGRLHAVADGGERRFDGVLGSLVRARYNRVMADRVIHISEAEAASNSQAFWRVCARGLKW